VCDKAIYMRVLRLSNRNFRTFESQIELAALKPSQIPISAPNPLQKNPASDIALSPQRLGMKPPSVEPTVIPIQIMTFEFIYLLYRGLQGRV